jgi:hypothetical protein
MSSIDSDEILAVPGFGFLPKWFYDELQNITESLGNEKRDKKKKNIFFKTMPRLYLSGKFSFVVNARLDTRIEWFLFTKCMLLLLMSLPDSTLTWSPLSAPLQ